MAFTRMTRTEAKRHISSDKCITVLFLFRQLKKNQEDIIFFCDHKILMDIFLPSSFFLVKSSSSQFPFFLLVKKEMEMYGTHDRQLRRGNT